MAKEWNSYEAPGGRDKVKDEIKAAKLNETERAKLKALMDMQANGELEYPTVKPLTDAEGLQEIRIKVGRRSFRLVFADLPDGLVLLAVHFFEKKANVAQRDIKLAVSRYKEWRSRQ